MLYLNAPYFIIDGIVLFPDHSHEKQFYYGPLAPHLSTDEDPQTGVQRPRIQVIKYRGDAGKGGFLNFDVNLGIDPDQLKDVARQLRNLADLDDDPVLSPIPYVDGTVRMMLLGKESPTDGQEEDDDDDEDNASEAGQPEFVLKIDHHAQPSLFGDNQASISAQLDEYGVTVLEEALQGHVSPIGIVYELTYLGLRPAYAARIHADWDRVYEHFDKTTSANLIFFSSEISEIVDELVESRVIEIEIDNLIAGDPTAGAIVDFESMVNEVKDMVLKSFFEPSLDPRGDNTDTIDDLNRLATNQLQIALSGGTGIGYRRREVTQIDRKTLNVSLKQRIAVSRTIYPQAHLRGLASVLREGSFDIDDFVLEVDLDDDWFKKREVRVISRANFENDGIASISVTLTYQDEQPRTVVLSPDNTDGTVEWNSVIKDDRMITDVQVQYTVNFADVNQSERPLSLTSDPITIHTQTFEVFPRNLYSLAPVNFVPINVPWDTYSNVTVHVRYKDLKNSINQRDTFLLDEDSTEKVWNQFIVDNRKTDYEYQFIYHGRNQADKVYPWLTSSNELQLIEDPTKGLTERSLTIQPAVIWSLVEMIFVDIWYEDKANGLRKDQIFQFSEVDKMAKTFTVKLLNPAQQLVHYKVTMLFKSGSFFELPPSSTRSQRIFLRSDMMGHKIIQVQPETANFADKGLENLEVSLLYNDEDSQLKFAHRVLFDSQDDAGYFEFDYVDTQLQDYSYEVTYRYSNGLSRTTDKISTNEELLVVPLD